MSHLGKEFSRIYDKNIDKIYRFICLKVGSQELAEDITSETFLRGWEAYKAQNPKRKEQNEIKNIQAFLYQIARNLIVDHYRQKSRAQLVSMENVPQVSDADTGLEEKIMLASDVEQVKAALAKVNDNYREIIVWYYLDEFTVPEIARIINKSEEAVRVTIHRALKALKQELGGV